jgi:hypothetical protein
MSGTRFRFAKSDDGTSSPGRRASRAKKRVCVPGCKLSRERKLSAPWGALPRAACGNRR